MLNDSPLLLLPPQWVGLQSYMSLPILIHMQWLGELLPGERSYLTHTAAHPQRHFLNQAFHFLLPELEVHRQGVAVIQSSVNPLPALQPVPGDTTSHFRGHLSASVLYIFQEERSLSVGLQWVRTPLAAELNI